MQIMILKFGSQQNQLILNFLVKWLVIITVTLAYNSENILTKQSIITDDHNQY